MNEHNPMRTYRTWCIAGAIFCLVVGALLHFTYEWFGGIWAAFSAVNESTWEHLKLFFVPAVLFGVVEFACFGRKTPSYLLSKLLSLLLGIATIIVLFYTYTGIVGDNFLPVDIAVFAAGVILSYLFLYRRLAGSVGCISSALCRGLSLAGIVALIVCFVVFTYSPPHIGLFRDPTNGGYGVAASSAPSSKASSLFLR